MKERNSTFFNSVRITDACFSRERYSDPSRLFR
jgi:hypothetical protein